MRDGEPRLSVIVPAYNARQVLPSCLEALLSSRRKPDELIVVDDRSTDETVAIARSMGARILEMPERAGPGGARNFAAEHATGDILLFVDADVVVRTDSLEIVLRAFRRNPGIAAVFGSYDDDPAEKNFLSQYKNLHHHYVHQISDSDAGTFWAGCGAIRRDVFLELGGFDLDKYPVPSIEDIELGYRLRVKGHRTLLEKDLCVKHLKRWTLRNLLWTDIFCRAVPWTRLILERRQMASDLNLKVSDRISSALVALSILLLPLSLLYPPALLGVPVCLGIIVFLNRDLYGFFLRHRGFLFLLRAIPVHLMYYVYSGSAFVFCWLQYRLRRFTGADLTASGLEEPRR